MNPKHLTAGVALLLTISSAFAGTEPFPPLPPLPPLPPGQACEGLAAACAAGAVRPRAMPHRPVRSKAHMRLQRRHARRVTITLRGVTHVSKVCRSKHKHCTKRLSRFAARRVGI